MLEQVSVQERKFGSEDVLSLVADKWTIRVLHAVLDGHDRFGELRRTIPAITRRMLTLRLRELERNGILQRIDYSEVPAHVEYRLSPLGASLAARLKTLCEWSEQNFAEVEAARHTYDAARARLDQ